MSGIHSPEAGLIPGELVARLEVDRRERPSRHGAILGEALAAIEAAGRQDALGLPEKCATCAFREGCMTNQMAATGMIALNIVLGVDKDRFACHHGMRDGEPQKLCAGYMAAMLAPFSVVKAVMEEMQGKLNAMSGPDQVRAAFDQWRSEVDPEGELDDYHLGRLYLTATTAHSVDISRQGNETQPSPKDAGHG